MTTVAEMIQWLSTLPQEAKVIVLQHSRGHDYYDQGGWCTTQDFDPTEVAAWSKDYENPFPTQWELYKDSDGEYSLTLGSMEN